jgi:hypothetical protein
MRQSAAMDYIAGFPRSLRAIALGLGLALSLPDASRAAEPASPTGEAPVDIEIPAIFAPVTIEARLDSYAYITVLLTPAAPDKALTIRAKMPFLRDAFLRELNKASIIKPGDPKTVDTVAVKARLIARMNQTLPEDTVADLKFEPIVFTPVQPQS